MPAAVTADVIGGEISSLSGTSNIALASGTDDLVSLEVASEPFIRPKQVPKQFNIAVIVAAALIFIVVIAWFETLRVWLEYAFNSSTKLLFKKALGDLVYAAIATIIAIFLIFLLMKFWVKN